MQIIAVIEHHRPGFVFPLGTNDHAPPIVGIVGVTGNHGVPIVGGVSSSGAVDKRVRRIPPIHAAHQVIRVNRIHPVLSGPTRKTTIRSGFFQITGIEQVNLLAINDCATGVAAIKVIGDIRVERIGMMQPPKSVELGGDMSPAGAFLTKRKRRIMLVENMKPAGAWRDEHTIGVIEAPLRRCDVIPRAEKCFRTHTAMIDASHITGHRFTLVDVSPG